MINQFKKIAIIAILIGTIGVAINLLFGKNTVTFLESYQTYGTKLTFYKFNFWNYILNIRMAIQDTTELQLTNNPLTWNNSGDWNALINNLGFILNVIIFAINIFIYPFRIAGYIIKLIIAIAGVNLQNAGGLNWLVVLVNTLMNLQIPYIE